MRNAILPSLIVISCIPLISGCATTGLGRTWAAPDAQATSFRKLAVIALTQQEVYRIQAEDGLVQEMPSNGVASHTLLPGLNALRDTAAVITTLRKAGCDGIVTVQLKSGRVRPDPNAPGTPVTASAGQAMDDYWTDPFAQEAESFAPNQYFAVEVHVFDMARGKMVWNGLAIEQNARDAADLMRMVRKDVVKDLRDRGLIVK